MLFLKDSKKEFLYHFNFYQKKDLFALNLIILHIPTSFVNFFLVKEILILIFNIFIIKLK